MLVSKLQSSDADGGLEHPALSAISPSSLRETVEALAFPRHYVANREANERARDWIFEELRCLGFFLPVPIPDRLIGGIGVGSYLRKTSLSSLPIALSTLTRSWPT